MEKRIIFKNKDNSIGIITPTDEALAIADIKTLAEKDVPHNLPYWIVEDITIPTDRTFRECWQVDESIEPAGFGGISNEFDAELLANYKESLNDSN